MLRPKLVIGQRIITAVVAPLALALSMGVSHPAAAACSGLPATAGNDTLDCNDANGAINLLTGDDKITINTGAVFTGTVTGAAGNDLIVINGGTSGNNVTAGTGTASLGDTADRIFMFDGTITGGEVQLGSGQNNFFVFMGGTIQPNLGGSGSVEINRGSRNAVLVFDGGTLTVEEGIEFQSGNAGLVAGPVDPTIYFRSGIIEAEEIELVATDFGGANPTDVTVIFDPVNSKDPAYFQALANAAANGADPTLSTANLNAALFSAPANPDDDHQMIVKAKEVEFGAGDDRLIFDGAINDGEGHHNLVLQGEEEEPGEFEITEFGGGDGDDTLTVTGQSQLLLGELESFEFLNVLNSSKLVLEGEEYDDIEELTIDGSSILWVTAATTFEAEHIEIGAPNGGAEPLKVSNQYAAFDPGGILMFGAQPAGEGDDDDDEEEASGPLNTVLEIGTNTVVNAGTLGTLNGIAGDTVTVIGGGYESQNGNFVIDTRLGDSNSLTDRFNLDPTQPVDGLTTIYVSNAGGIGGITGHGATDGIVIVTGPAGFGPTGAFQLGVNLTGRREVLAGAFSYQLVTSGTTARLQSDILDQVPAYTAVSSVAQRFASAGLGTLYKRMGEIRLGQGGDQPLGNGGGGAWVRGIYGDYDIDPSTGYAFSQRNDGLLMGADAGVRTEGGRLLFGLFGGYGSADADVAATIWGLNSVSNIDLSAWSFGGYGTYYENGRPGTGYYFDAVFKADMLDYQMTSVARSTSASTDGYAATISGETGYGFAVGSNLSLQPQAQLSYTTVSTSNYTDSYGIKVGNGAAESLIGRASMQLQGNYGFGGSGWFTPYVIASVLSEFLGDNETVVGGTPFQSDMGLTWFEAGGGVTAELSNSISLYGSAEYSFGDVEGWGGTGGVKARW